MRQYSWRQTRRRHPDAPTRPTMNSKYARELTTLVAAPAAIWIVGWSHAYVFDATLSLVAMLALYELLVLGERKGFHVPKTLCTLVMLFIIAAFILEPVSVEMGVFVALLILPASFV